MQSGFDLCGGRNDTFPLSRVQATDSDSTDFDTFVDQFDVNATTSKVYIVQKILDDAVVDGIHMFKVKWKDWPASTATWEPREHLADYGAADTLTKYEAQKGICAFAMSAIQQINRMTEVEKAVLQLMRRHKEMKGAADLRTWCKAYMQEEDAVVQKYGRLVELHGDDKATILKTERVIHLRMNPEIKKEAG